MQKKRSMLAIFFQAGQDCKSTLYQKQLNTLTQRKTMSSCEEWLPWATMVSKYGEKEALRRLQRGTLLSRRSKSDAEEFEFRYVQSSVRDDVEMARQKVFGSEGKVTGDKAAGCFADFAKHCGDEEEEGPAGSSMGGMLKNLNISAGTLRALKMEADEGDETEEP